jgi:hypothetical protein
VRRLGIDSVAETEAGHGEDGLPESRREAVVKHGQMAWGPFYRACTGTDGTAQGGG